MSIATTDLGTLLIILIMALVTLATRWGGVFIMAFVPISRRVQQFIRAMSGSVLIALLAPLAAQGDGGAKLALLVTAGVALVLKKPLPAISAGIVCVPEERQKQGAIIELPIAQNISLPQLNKLNPRGVLNDAREWQLADEYARRLQVKAFSWRQPVETLSGGNQQKVVIGKWLATHPEVIILDEPTKGIDIGSKAAVHQFMSELVSQGLAVIMVSSELPEVMGMADRIIVMHEGLMVAEYRAGEATAETIVSAASGIGQEAA